MMQTALVALGANVTSPLGPPSKTLSWAIRALAEKGGLLRSVSRFFATPCFPAGAGPDYVNAACTLAWPGGAVALLDVLHGLERTAARERGIRWGQRTLDLDLIALEDAVLPDAASQTAWREMPADLQRLRSPQDLVLPHPRLQDRSFVLVPLADIAPGWRHPLLQRTIAELSAARPDEERAEIRPIFA